MTRTSARQSNARWVKELTPGERAAELAEQERLTTRDIRRAFLRTIGGCFLSLAAGLTGIGYALHTTDPAVGQIAFLGGLLIGYVGITVSLALYYLKGERSGWWA